MKLEYVDSLILAHPFIKGFEQTSYCASPDEIRAVAQGEISEAIKKRKPEDIEGKEGGGPVYSTTFYIGLAIEPKPGTSCLNQKIHLGLTVCSGNHWSKTIGYIIPYD